MRGTKRNKIEYCQVGSIPTAKINPEKKGGNHRDKANHSVLS